MMGSHGGATAPSPQLLGIGNPLLDMQAQVTTEFLSKYQLKANDAILAGDIHQQIYNDMERNFNIEYLTGGAALNAIRVCQGLFVKGHEKRTGYIGCIGKDVRGDQLKKLCSDSGVDFLNMTSETSETGVCGVLITGTNRSLCTRLGAANDYKADHLKSADVVEKMKIAQVFYAEGYFLTVSPEAMIQVGSHAASSKGKVFAMNLSAPFLIEFFKDAMLSVLPYVDYVFGNSEEFELYGKVHGCSGKGIVDIAKAIFALPKLNGDRPRTVIVTSGSEPTIVVSSLHPEAPQTFPVAYLDQGDIVDTNAAGDAFAGGYLFGICNGLDVGGCVTYGHYAARHVIQRPGCSFDFSKDVPKLDKVSRA